MNKKQDEFQYFLKLTCGGDGGCGEHILVRVFRAFVSCVGGCLVPAQAALTVLPSRPARPRRRVKIGLRLISSGSGGGGCWLECGGGSSSSCSSCGRSGGVLGGVGDEPGWWTQRCGGGGGGGGLWQVFYGCSLHAVLKVQTTVVPTTASTSSPSFPPSSTLPVSSSVPVVVHLRTPDACSCPATRPGRSSLGRG